MSAEIMYGFSTLDIPLLLIVFCPLLSFIICSFISEHYSWSVPLIAAFLMLVSAISSAIVLIDQWNAPEYFVMKWFTAGEHSFSANILVTNQSLLMLVIVSLISFLIHLYSIGYMAGDMHVERYFAVLGFFTFSMQGIVLADSLLLIFVFWELVGFSSYLLIGHYREKIEAGQASKKAFIMNRLGDAGFLIGLMILWANTGSLNLSEVLLQGNSGPWQMAASLCIFCGVIGKSAQFPLFTWLPDAMEGPTPVSALIHAATMVAAGVYLMTRVFLIFPPSALLLVAVVGVITALVGALAALSQFDIKKLLAYSTISQLGFMMMAIGSGAVDAALLHLFTHAFFKACLFLCAGAVIHSLHQAQQQSHLHFDVQDIRNMGGLRKKLPVTFTTIILSGASLAGLPFFSGFLSKEAILTTVWNSNTLFSQVIFVAILIVSFLTVIYTFRLIWFAFLGEERFIKNLTISEVPLVMRIPMTALAVCSLWISVSWNPFSFKGWILAETQSPSIIITGISIILVVSGSVVSWLFFRSRQPTSSSVLRNSFYFDSLSKSIFLKTIFSISRVTGYADKNLIDKTIHFNAYSQVTLAHVVQWIDVNIVDGMVHFTTGIITLIGSAIRSFQGGKIQLYIFWAVFAIIIFLICALIY